MANASRARGHVCSAHPIARTEDLPPGTRQLVDIAGRSIGVFNVDGTYYALRNLCPHQQAPLCEGPVMDTTLPSAPGTYVFGLEGRVLRCPWHGWEFDLATGHSLFDPRRCRVKAYPVTTGTLGEPPTNAHVNPIGYEPTQSAVERFDVTVENAIVFVHVRPR